MIRIGAEISTAQFQAIKALIFDIDGVLTDCTIGYDGEHKIKFFNVRDGHGLKLAQRSGLKIGAISGREDAANRARLTELGFDFIYGNSHDKLQTFQEMLQQQELAAEECLYMGDDVIDLGIMRHCGIAITVADAFPYMDTAADFRTECSGGHGAVREVIDFILQKTGRWNSVMARYGLEEYSFPQERTKP